MTGVSFQKGQFGHRHTHRENVACKWKRRSTSQGMLKTAKATVSTEHLLPHGPPTLLIQLTASWNLIMNCFKPLSFWGVYVATGQWDTAVLYLAVCGLVVLKMFSLDQKRGCHWDRFTNANDWIRNPSGK